ncbi:MAG: glutamyl-tRNA amidotransferase [Chthoniobacterales bacterium]|nr:MAG: glutamyl-tRNA amidotransferase [Chthoniobacterales bacterium]
MSLQQKINDDLKEAMRAKDAARLSVLRLVKAALMNSAIEKVGADGELNDADATAVIRKQVKERQDSIESFKKGGRPELAEKENAEIAVLNAYLPQAMSAEELQSIVSETIRETGATSRAQMGAVMKALQTKVAGRADGKTLSAEVQRQLRS